MFFYCGPFGKNVALPMGNTAVAPDFANVSLCQLYIKLPYKVPQFTDAKTAIRGLCLLHGNAVKHVKYPCCETKTDLKILSLQV